MEITNIDKKYAIIFAKWLSSLDILQKNQKMDYGDYLNSLDENILAQEIFKFAKFDN